MYIYNKFPRKQTLYFNNLQHSYCEKLLSWSTQKAENKLKSKIYRDESHKNKNVATSASRSFLYDPWKRNFQKIRIFSKNGKTLAEE